jgi:hypothetical protein
LAAVLVAEWKVQHGQEVQNAMVTTQSGLPHADSMAIRAADSARIEAET